MKLMAVRRVQIMQQGKSDVPLPPAPPPHPGYAPNAAVAAIKRHAQEFVSPKENEVCAFYFSSPQGTGSIFLFLPKLDFKHSVLPILLSVILFF